MHCDLVGALEPAFVWPTRIFFLNTHQPAFISNFSTSNGQLSTLHTEETEFMVVPTHSPHRGNRVHGCSDPLCRQFFVRADDEPAMLNGSLSVKLLKEEDGAFASCFQAPRAQRTGPYGWCGTCKGGG